MTVDRMRELVDRLNETAYQYYTLDAPTISDVEWDRLYDELVKLESETGERLPDSPTRRVGGEVLAGFEPHTHLARLWSMGKAQSIEALEDWARRAEKLRHLEQFLHKIVIIPGDGVQRFLQNTRIFLHEVVSPLIDLTFIFRIVSCLPPVFHPPPRVRCFLRYMHSRVKSPESVVCPDVTLLTLHIYK